MKNIISNILRKNWYENFVLVIDTREDFVGRWPKVHLYWVRYHNSPILSRVRIGSNQRKLIIIDLRYLKLNSWNNNWCTESTYNSTTNILFLVGMEFKHQWTGVCPIIVKKAYIGYMCVKRILLLILRYLPFQFSYIRKIIWLRQKQDKSIVNTQIF